MDLRPKPSKKSNVAYLGLLCELKSERFAGFGIKLCDARMTSITR